MTELFRAATAGWLLLSLTSATAADREVFDLRAGKPLVRSMHAEGGALVLCTVEQLGVDVSVTLSEGSETLLRFDDAKEASGNERAEWIATHPTDVTLTVSANAQDGRGRVALECAVRPASDDDTLHFGGRQALRDADKLVEEGSAESLQKAEPLYARAVEAFTKTNDQRLLGVALDSSGWLQDLEGNKRAALETYQRALVARRTANDRAGEAMTLQGVGLAHLYLGEYDEALKVNEEVVRMARESKDRSLEAGTLHNIGGIYWSTDEMSRALEYYEKALSLEKTLPDKANLASTYNNIGDVYRRLGDNDTARTYFNKALQTRRSLGNKRGEAHSLHTLGLVELAEDHPKKALENFTRALELRRATGDKRGEAYSLGGSGAALLKLGDSNSAVQRQTEALELWTKLGERRAEAETRQSLADALAAAGRVDEAVKYYEEALPVSAELRDRTTEANALLGLAKVQRAQGKLDDAQQHIEKAIGIVDDLRGRVANLELRTAYFSSVKKFYDFYIDLLMQRHRAEPKAGYDIRALQAAEASRARTLLDTLAAGGVDLRSPATTELASREREALVRLQRSQKQLTALLQSKGKQSDIERASAEVERLTGEHEDALGALRRADPGYEALVVARPASAEEIQKVLDSDTVLLEYQLGDEESRVWIASRESIRVASLPPRQELESAALRLHDALEARNRVVANESAEKRASRIARADEQVRSLQHSLGALVLPAEALKGSRRIVVSADGALQYVPFRILQPRGSSRMLLQSHDVVAVPGASFLVASRARQRARRTPSIAVFADPVFDSRDPRVGAAASAPVPASDSAVRSAASDVDLAKLPRLRFSREEANAIAAQADGRVMQALDFDAAKERLSSATLRRFTTLHFATHGILDSRRPELSGLVLSLVDKKGKPRDGFLRLRQIYALDLDADLVVLSACQTALGKEVRGEGLLGLTRGFMYAGAPRVIASLWRVDDRATALLMSRFYAGLRRGEAPAAALRAAQLDLARDPRWSSPYYWASFQLQGDWS